PFITTRAASSSPGDWSIRPFISIRGLSGESESGYPPPGLFQVVANGTADLTVYREHSFVARLAQDTLLKRQNDLVWWGPVTERIDAGMQVYLDAVWRRVRHLLPRNMGTWPPFLADVWISTLCRIWIG